MVRMPSIKLSAADQKKCLDIAKQSILSGLQKGTAYKVSSHDFSSDLQTRLASFVTLHKYGQLRGCIGTLEAYQPLIDDIAEHAFAAAFHDPRFPAVDESELEQLDIEVSVLSKPESIIFKNEDDLLQQIKPNIDGLILEHGSHRGTFLPSVWEQLPDKKDFINHLKMKAGLNTDWWENDVKISRYEATKF